MRQVCLFFKIDLNFGCYLIKFVVFKCCHNYTRYSKATRSSETMKHKYTNSK